MPLVSCVVATGDRQEFLPQLLRCFLRQTYRDKELIVVDGGREPSEALCAGLPGVRYLRASPESTLGERLNLGCDAARGPILQKLDDDDFYHRTFLDRAVSALLSARDRNTIVAWDCFHVLIKGERQLRFSGHGWAAGGTLCFPRSLWTRAPFYGNAAADYNFLHETAATQLKVCAPALYLYVRHGANVWHGETYSADALFRSQPPATVRLADLVEPEDVPFYQRLMESELTF